MNSIPFSSVRPQAVTTAVALEPVYNALMSLALLTADEATVEVEPWVTETAGRLTVEQRYHNRLIFEGLGEGLLIDVAYTDFPAYLEALAAQSPTALRDRVIQPLTRLRPAANKEEDVLPAPTDLLADEALFLDCLARYYVNPLPDQSLQQALYHLLNDPAAMHRLIITHLRALWKDFLAAEWERRSFQLNSLVHLLNQRTWPAEPAGQAIRTFIRRDLPDSISLQLAGVEQIIFVPSPHIHLYATRFGSENTIWVFVLGNFWALPTREEPIQRREVLGPLRALADETRLRLLELLAAHETLQAQELVTLLEVSQPTVSRHLKQLRAAGIITEERGPEGIKEYCLNPAAIEGLYHTLSQLFSAENARMILNDVRPSQPAALRRFLDRQGLITIWPRKRKSQQLILTYLSAKFEPDEDYTEKQVNEILAQWHTYEDPVSLRRELCDAGLLKRTDNGARYWRPIDSTTSNYRGIG